MDREKKIVRTSILGILVNVALVAFKATVGLISGSIAVILDAVNNLSDALSSVITIVGTKLAGKAPDKKHPYGYGRIEYMTSVVVAVIVLIAGVTAARESVEKIINPTAAEYSVVSLVIIVAAIITKLVIGRYVKGVGQKINSGSLIASGSDALFDAILSTGTLVAAGISMLWGLSLEGWFGAVISLFIIKAGVEMLTEPLGSMIGDRADKELTDKLKERVCSFEGVRGAYDLTLHNYGPARTIGSVHIELADGTTAREIHKLTRDISSAIYAEFGIVLTIGVYAANDITPETTAIREYAESVVAQFPEILQMHGFYADMERGAVTFDLIVDFKADSHAVCADVVAKMKEKYPDLEFYVILDSDYSD